MRLYSAIKALILSFLFPSCGSWRSALLVPVSHPHSRAVRCLCAPSPVGGTAPCPRVAGGLGDLPPCLPSGGTGLAQPTLLGRLCLQTCSEACCKGFPMFVFHGFSRAFPHELINYCIDESSPPTCVVQHTLLEAPHCNPCPSRLSSSSSSCHQGSLKPKPLGKWSLPLLSCLCTRAG